MTGGRTIPSFTIRSEPIGSLRLPEINLLNLRLEKGFRLGDNKLVGRVNLYNALNSNTVTGMSFLSGPSYGRILSILPPRVVELGVQFSY